MRPSLHRMFQARSVAVVGASRDPSKTGHVILRNILEGGYRGTVYPVNPRVDEILGLKAYPSLRELPEAPDLAVFVVPARLVPDLVAEAAELGVGAAVVISGGFREAGRGDLEEALRRTAREGRIRILGPNCQGFDYRPNHLCVTWPPRRVSGSLAIISQSGTVGAALADWAEEEELGTTVLVNLGNRVDLTEIDFMSHFARDPSVGAVVLYVEAVTNGRAFIEAARRLSARKPLVVLKGGRTLAGKKASQSHTGALAGRYEVFRGVCRELGVVLGESLEELYDAGKMAVTCGRPAGPRLVVITSSGGSGILACDRAQELGLQLAQLPSDAVSSLRADLPSHCIVGNPLDLTGDASAERFERAARRVVEAGSCDALLLIFGDPIAGAARAAARIRGMARGTVVICCFLGGGSQQAEEVRACHRSGIPAYPTPDRAVAALAHMWHRRHANGEGGVACLT